MPKDTFFNLPEDKRALICSVAVDEFASYPFEQASINRIVADAGIAKGSFYQYFTGKKDLFLYLLKMATQEKLAYFSSVLAGADEHTLFSLIRDLYLAGIQFAGEHPKYELIGRRILENKNAPIYKEAIDENSPVSYEFFGTLLENAIERGEVRADIDVKLFAYMITAMNTLIVEYWTEYVAQDFQDGMMETIDQFLDFLKNGIGAPKVVEPGVLAASTFSVEQPTRTRL